MIWQMSLSYITEGFDRKVVVVFNVIYHQKIRESDFMSCSGLCSLYFQRADGIG